LLGPWHVYIAAIPIWSQYVAFIEWCLRQITDFTGNFGIAIIVFTIVLKTLMLPMTVKSIRSTAAMQELQPKIKDIQKKYGKDRARVQTETMALYNQYRINPVAGCLPMVLQIPIFMGLYFAIRTISKSGDAGGFLWLDDLAQPDPYHILPIMAGVFQFVQTKMMRPSNAPKITDPQQQMMNSMMNFMPMMVVLFGWRFASGPVLYWATQSIYSVIQQWFITGWGQLKNWAPWLPELPEHRRLGHRAEPLKSVEPDAPPKGLMARMQQQMLVQQDRTAERTKPRQDQPASKSSAKKSAASQPVDATAPRIVRAQRGDVNTPDITVEPTPSGKRAKRDRAQAGVSDRTVSGGADDALNDESVNDSPAGGKRVRPRT